MFNMEYKSFSIRIPLCVYDKIHELSQVKERSKNYIITKILENYTNENSILFEEKEKEAQSNV